MQSTAPIVKNVVFFLIGEIHSNPHSTGLIHSSSKIFHEKRIPQVVCSFEPHTLDIGKKIANDLNAELNFERTGKGPFDLNLKNIVKEGKDSSEKYECIQEKILQHRNSQVNEPYINAVTASQLVANMARIDLDSFLLEKNIPYQGLASDKEQEFNVNLNVMMENRTLELTKNIFGKALPKISKTGGIIWISLNALETHHLAVNILNHIKTHKLTNEFSFLVHPLMCSSPSFKEGAKSVYQFISQKDFRQIFRNLDSFYDKFTLEMITDIQEESRGVFKSNDFSRVFDYSTRFYSKSNIYHIPNFDEGKKKLILENNGKVLEEVESYAKVTMASEILLKSLRDQLGIVKQKITFQNSDVYKSREAQLLSYPQFTLEPLSNPDQLFITFPQEDRQLVSDIVKGTS